MRLDDQRTDTRSYSVVKSNADGSRLIVTVLRVPESRGGSVFMHALEVGDELETTQPLQNFPLRIGAPRYVLVAGGIGITAMVEMARVLKSVRADYEFVYVGRNRTLMADATTLAELHVDRLRVHFEEAGEPLDLEALIGAIAAGDRALHVRADPVYGGPTPGLGTRPTALARTCATRTSATVAGSTPRSSSSGSPSWHRDRRRPPHTMLEALAEAGSDLMYDCRKGGCGLCRVGVLEVDGELDHRDVFFSRAQQESNRQLRTCVSRPSPHQVGPHRQRSACACEGGRRAPTLVRRVDRPSLSDRGGLVGWADPW